MSGQFALGRPVRITEAMLTATNVTISEAAWSVGTTYADGAIVRRAKDGIQHRFESVTASNLGNDPALDVGAVNWVDLGAVNAHKMLDGAIQTQTTNADEIAVTVTFGAADAFDWLYLAGLSGTEATVTLTDPVEGVIYDETFDLIADSGITDWWGFFFEPITRVTEIAITDLNAAYSGLTMAVSITEAGATVACGAVVPALSKVLGYTQYGVSIGIQDYSVKTTDDFGNFTILERAFAKRLEANLFIPSTLVDEAASILTSYRATPALFIAAAGYTATVVWGFVREWSVGIEYPDMSVAPIQIEGLA